MSSNDRDDIEQELLRNQENAQVRHESAYSVTPMDYDPVKEEEKKREDDFQLLLPDYVNKARGEGFPEDPVVAAAKIANCNNCKSYDDFKDLVVKSLEPVEEEKPAVDRRLVKAVDYEIRTKLSKIDNIGQYLANLINGVYHTTAAGVVDVLYHAEFDEEFKDNLNLEVYQTPMYSVILQIESEWVGKLIQKTVAAWDGHTVVQNQIDAYIDSLGGPKVPGDYESEYKALIDILPENLKNENSPDLYKAYRAMLLLQRDNTDPYLQKEFESKLLNNADAYETYASEVEFDMLDGTPSEAASYDASSVAYEQFTEEEKSGLNVKVAKTLANAVGWGINLKADAVQAYSDTLKSTIGEENYIAYEENKETKRLEREAAHELRKAQHAAEKEERRAEKAEEERVKSQQQQQQTQQQAQQQPQKSRSLFGRNHDEYYDNRYRNQYMNSRYANHNHYGYNQGYNSRAYGQGNYSPQVPIWLTVSLLNIIIGLIIWLVCGKTLAIISAVGLVISTVGFLKQKHGEKGSVLTIVVGYCIVALTIFIYTKK